MNMGYLSGYIYVCVCIKLGTCGWIRAQILLTQAQSYDI